MGDFATHLDQRRTLADGREVTIRPIEHDDEAAERGFFERLCGESKRLRFLKFVSCVNEQLIHRFTHVDYHRQMAFVCEATVDGRKELVGEARYAANNGRSCEFSVVIADDWHKSGIAGLLMVALIRYARASGFETMEGMVLRDNRAMVRFVRALDFEVAPVPEEPTLLRVVRQL